MGVVNMTTVLEEVSYILTSKRMLLNCRNELALECVSWCRKALNNLRHQF